MNENRALVSVLKQKHHSVPLGVRYWTFYKSAVLEDARMREAMLQETGAASFARFHRLMVPLLKSSPFRPNARRSRATCERLNRDMITVLYEYHKALMGPWVIQGRAAEGAGLGLFAREPFVWTDAHAKQLFGIVCGVSEGDFQTLCEKKYPSLFSSRDTGDGILFGPASLLNHACDAPFTWTNPVKRGVPALFDGFDALRLKKRARKEVSFEANEEICVLYGMKRRDFVCKCRKCGK